MALINHEKKFIFIHIYKCAGTAIRKQFSEGSEEIGGYHITAEELLELMKKEGNEKMFWDYFVFACVRNPFDQMVSLYEFIKEFTAHPYNREVIKMTFSEFLKWFTVEKLNQDRTDTGRVSVMSEYVFDENGANLCDSVIKYENIDSEIAELSKRFGISKNLEKENVTMLRNGKSYKEYYTASDIEIVEECFAPDMYNFNYTF